MSIKKKVLHFLSLLQKSSLRPVVATMTFVAIFGYGAHAVITSPVAEASFTQNNSEGYWNIDFLNNTQGMAPDSGGLTAGIDVNTAGGIALIKTGNTTATIYTNPVTPSSFSGWDKVIVDATYSTDTDVLVAVTDCAVAPSDLLSPTVLDGGEVDISSISNTVSCVRVRIDLSDTGGIRPVVNDIRVTWDPLPVLLVSHASRATVQAGDTMTMTINYSVSFVNETGLVVYVPLPRTVNGTVTNYTPGYGFNPNPTFVSAQNGGQYTGSAITVGGTAIPAGSVYWNIGTAQAGRTGVLTYQVAVPQGTEDDTQYSFQASAKGAQSVLVRSDASSLLPGEQPVDTVVVSAPAISLDSDVFETVWFSQHYVTDTGAYDLDIRYELTLNNTSARVGGEALWNAGVSVNLNSIFTRLTTDCGVVAPATRVTALSAGGVLSGSTITWPGENIFPVQQSQKTFRIDYTDCPTDLVTPYTLSATVIADNSAPQTVFQPVYRGLSTAPQVTLEKKGKEVVLHNTAEPYNLTYANQGPVALADIVMLDKVLTTTQELQSVSGGANTTIYYNTTGAGNLATAPPAYTLVPGVGITGAGWTTTAPTPIANAVWIAAYVTCADSSFFPSPAGNTQCFGTDPSGSVLVKTQLKPPAAACLEYQSLNTGVFTVHKRGADENNATLVTSVQTVNNQHTRVARPAVPSLFGTTDVTAVVSAGDLVEFTLELHNGGTDISTTTTATLPIPRTTVNGVPNTPLTFVDAIGGGVSVAGLPNSVTVSLGAMPKDSRKTVKLIVRVPAGVSSGAVLSFAPTATGVDPEGCAPVVSITPTTTTVLSTPALDILTSVRQSTILPESVVSYTTRWQSSGTSPISNTFILNAIPAETIFTQAFTTGTDSSGTTHTCTGCRVFFSNALPPLPTSLTPTNPLTVNDILTTFTAGTEVSPGVWESIYAENTRWVAYSIDNQLLATPMTIPGRVATVGLDIKNDQDGAGIQTTGSTIGTIISNEAGVVATELIQSVGNRVDTIVLDEVALSIQKNPSASVVGAGQTFYWDIPYHNSGTAPMTTLTLTDAILPTDSSFVSATHQWNATAVGFGAPSGVISMTGNPNLQVTTAIDGTVTVTFDVRAYRGLDVLPLEGGVLRLQMQAYNSSTSNTTITNSVTGTYQGIGPVQSTIATGAITVQNPDLLLQKSASDIAPVAGDVVDFTLLLLNNSQLNAPGITMTDVLPLGVCYVPGSTFVRGPLTYTIAQPVVTGNCVGIPQTLTWNSTALNGPAGVGVLPIQDPVYIGYRATVAVTVGQGVSLTNSASIATTIIENAQYANVDTSTVTTPYPDPYISLTGDTLVNPGDAMTHTITYANASRQSATNISAIYSIPDHDTDGTPDFKFVSVSGSGGESFYYHAGPITLTPPTFNPASPLTNGWTAAPIAPVGYVAIRRTTFASLEGPRTVDVLLRAIDPDTNTNSPTGIIGTGRVQIFTPAGQTDAVTTNNIATHSTRTPGYDLAVTLTGGREGIFPGIAPNKEQTYTATYANNGSVAVCDVSFSVTLPAETEFLSPATNANTIALTSAVSGTTVSILDALGAIVTVPVSYTVSGSGQTRTITLGDTLQSPSQTCLPPESQGVVTIYTKVLDTVLDGVAIASTATITTASPGIEVDTTNNTSTSTTYVYRSDLTTTKSGQTQTADTVQADPLDTITYTVTYDNIGNMDAENAILRDTFSSDVCYVSGSLVAPNGTILQFSNDNGVTWTYVPIAGPTGDCAVTDMRLVFTSALPAPAYYDSEATFTDFVDANFVGVKEVTQPGGQETLTLTNPYFFDSGTVLTASEGGAEMGTGDFNEDGYLDIVTPGTSGTFPAQLFLGNGQGGFTVSTIPGSNSRGSALAVADYNNDGNLDFVTVGSAGTFASQLFLGSGTGTFTVSSITNNWSGVSAVAGDFDEDGFMDVVTSGGGSVSAQIWIGNGAGSFTASNIAGSNGWGLDAVLGDFNNDANLDFATVGSSGNTGQLFRGNGSGGFTVTSIGSNGQGRHITALNINGDAYLDLVTGGGVTIQGQVFLGSAGSTFTVSTLTGSNGTGFGIATADFNGDTIADVMTAGSGGSPQLFFGTGTGLALQTFSSGYTTGRNLVVGDFTSDGKVDAVTTGVGALDGVLFKNRQGEYGSSGTYTTIVSADPSISAWRKLLVTETLPAGTSLSYEALPLACSGAPLVTSRSASQGVIDISAIPATTTSWCLKTTWTTTDSSNTPVLDAWRATYASTLVPSVTYQAVVDSAPVLGTIGNTVAITSDTSEISTTNNTATKNFTLKQADIGVLVLADVSAFNPSDPVNYTITYQNTGVSPASGFSLTHTFDHQILDTPASIVAGPTSLGQTLVCTYIGLGTIYCDEDGNNMTPSTLVLAPTESGTITVSTSVLGSAVLGDTVAYAVQGATTTYQSITLNDTSTTVGAVFVAANNYVRIAGPTQAYVGDSLSFSIPYGNNGNKSADDTRIIMDITTGGATVRGVSSSDPGIACVLNPPSQAVCGDMGYTLVQGPSYTITLDIDVDDDINLLATNAVITIDTLVKTTSLETATSDNRVVRSLPIVPAGLSSITGKVFEDTNANLLYDGSDVGINTVTMSLSGTDIYGVVIARTTTTNASGDYSFASLRPGTYTVTQTHPTTYNSVGAIAGTNLVSGNGTVSSNDVIANITVGENNTSLQNNFAELAGSISGTVFADTNGSLSYTPVADIGLLGVRVVLVHDVNANGIQDFGEPTRVLFTDLNGEYEFTSVPFGDYIVRISDTIGMLTSYTAISGLASGGVDGIPKNVAGYRVVTTTGAPTDALADFGYTPIVFAPGAVGTIGTTVFVDTNGDGIKNGVEAGADRVSVELYQDNDLSSSYSVGDTLLQRVYTTATGEYIFGNVALDRRYIVRVGDIGGVLTGYIKTFGTPHTNDHGQQSAGYAVYLQSGVNESVVVADFGYKPPYPDLSIVKSHAGLLVLGTPVTYSIVVTNKVTATQSATSPIRVTDTLVSDLSYMSASGTDWDCSATVAPLVDCTYIGTYPVAIGAVLPTLSITAMVSPVAGSTLANSATVTTPLEDSSVLADNTGSDPSTYVLASASGVVGTHVWIDEDRDGFRDVSEPGIQNARVDLYRDWDSNLAPDDVNSDTIVDVLDRIATATTDSAGYYVFSGLSIDDGVTSEYRYLAYVDQTTIPAGHTLRLGTPNVDENSQNDTGLLITLSVGTPYTISADFGYEPPSPDLTITKTHTTTPVHQGDTVEFVITVANNPLALGSVPATNVITVTDVMPQDMILDPTATSTATGPSWNCSASTALRLTCTTTGSTVSPGTTLSPIRAMILVAPLTIPMPISNVASVATVREQVTALANNSATDNFTVILDNVGLISGVVWTDANRNGVKDYVDRNSNGSQNAGEEEQGIGAVTIDLYRDVNEDSAFDGGDVLLSTTTTQTGAGTLGQFSFTALERDLGLGYYPYLVRVRLSDITAINPAYAHTLGIAGTDNHSQNYLGYPITLDTARIVNTTADFGFGLPPVLTITAIGPSASALVNTTTSFSLVVTNVGSGTTDGSVYTVTTTLPPGLAFDALTTDPACTAVGSVVTCTATTVLPHLGGIKSFVIGVTSSLPAVYPVLGSVSGGGSASPATSSSVPVVFYAPTVGGGGGGGSSRTVTDVCSNITGVQSVVPRGYRAVGTICTLETGDTPLPVSAQVSSSGTQLCDPYLARDIIAGGKNNPSDVKKLELFLNEEMGTTLAVNGIYEEVDIRTLLAFQKKRREEKRGIAHSVSGTVSAYGLAEINLTVCSRLTTCPHFVEYHKRGDRKGDVVKIQQFLNTVLPKTTLPITGVYDSATFVAVKEYQTRYAEFILRAWSIPQATGWWYKSSRNHANHMVGCPEGEIAIKGYNLGTQDVRLIDATTSTIKKGGSATTSSYAGVDAYNPTGQSTSSGSQCYIDYKRLIRIGVRGEDVRQVQNCMNSLGYTTGVTDGIYGKNTYAGITAYQRDKKIKVDGIVGPQTASELNSLTGGVASPVVSSQKAKEVQVSTQSIEPVTTQSIVERDVILTPTTTAISQTKDKKSSQAPVLFVPSIGASSQ